MDQMYCTHCTYGNSALERRTGDTKDRVVGYSVRASSFKQPELLKIYRAVEPLLYYELPEDTPAQKTLTVAPQAAPRRLLFLPNISGLKVAGQICYRPQDETGRRSYFAHLLLGSPDPDGGDGWGVLDCLRWWGSPAWTLSADNSVGWDLAPMTAEQMLRDATPAICDDILRAFLFSEAKTDLSRTTDPQLIPPRWQAMSAETRRRFFRDALLAYLAAAEQDVSGMFLMEPSVAALVYYGIARLLPEGLRSKISFSTYEPTARRVATALAAMTFDNPDKAGDLPSDRYTRWFVCNTFRPERKSDIKRPCSTYVDDVLSVLESGAADGKALDEVLSGYEERRCRDVPCLRDMARERHMVLEAIGRMLGGERLGDLQFSDLDHDEFRKRFLPRLIAAWKDDAARTINDVAKSPDNVLKIAALYRSADISSVSGAEAVLHELFDRLSGDDLVRFALDSGIDDKYRVRLLRKFIKDHGELPARCSGVWQQGMALSVLRGWGVETYKRLSRQIAPAGEAHPRFASRSARGSLTGQEAFAQNLLALACESSDDRDAPRDAFIAIATEASDDAVVCASMEWLGQQEDVEVDPKLHGCLSKSVGAIWRSLPLSADVPRRLAVLRIAERRGLINCGEPGLRSWSELKDVIQAAEVRLLKRSRLPWRAKSQTNELARELALKFKNLPVGQHDDFDTVSARIRCLEDLATQYDCEALTDGNFVACFRAQLMEIVTRSRGRQAAGKTPGGARGTTTNATLGTPASAGEAGQRSPVEASSRQKYRWLVLAVVLLVQPALVVLSALSLAALLGYKPAIRLLTARRISSVPQAPRGDGPVAAPPETVPVHPLPENPPPDQTGQVRPGDRATSAAVPEPLRAMLDAGGGSLRAPRTFVNAHSPREDLDGRNRNASSGVTLWEADLGRDLPKHLRYNLAIHGWDQVQVQRRHPVKVHPTDASPLQLGTPEYVPSVLRTPAGLTALMTVKPISGSDQGKPLSPAPITTSPVATFHLEVIAPRQCALNGRLLVPGDTVGGIPEFQQSLGLCVAELSIGGGQPDYVALRGPQTVGEVKLAGGKTSLERGVLPLLADVRQGTQFLLGQGTITYSNPAVKMSFGSFTLSRDQSQVADGSQRIVLGATEKLGLAKGSAADKSGLTVNNVRVQLTPRWDEKTRTVALDFSVETVPSGEEIGAAWKRKLEGMDSTIGWFQGQIDVVNKYGGPAGRPFWQAAQFRAAQELVNRLRKDNKPALDEGSAKLLVGRHPDDIISLHGRDEKSFRKLESLVMQNIVRAAGDHKKNLEAERTQSIEAQKAVQADIAKVTGAATACFEVYRLVGEKIVVPVVTIPGTDQTSAQKQPR